jgi:excisionase family DNA binding protein
MPELSQPYTFRIPIPGKLLFDRSEFASLTSLSLRTVSYLIADGTIRIKRVGARVLSPRAELLRFAEIEEPTNRG